MFDVIVAGAGPGGASAAYSLGEAGLKVLVLEKERLPRYKTCGGGVSIRMLEKYFPFSFDEVIECRAESITYMLGERETVVRLGEPSMVTVMRERFDAHILSHARAEVISRAALARVTETPDHVAVETAAGQVFTARYLIGADGANSAAARLTGLRRQAEAAGSRAASGRVKAGSRAASGGRAAAVEVEAPAPPEMLARYQDSPAFIFGDTRLGYAWIFPKADHLSVGAAILHPKPGEIQALLRKTARRCGVALEEAKIHGHIIPLHLRRAPVATRRVLLVGDAAGLVAPFSGEGIRMAIKSGRIAAEAVISGKTGAYAGEIEARIGRDLRVSALLGLFFYNLPFLCYTFGAQNPFASQALMDNLSDEAGSLEVLLRVFATAPLFLLTEAAAALLRAAGRPGQASGLRDTFYWGR